MMNPPTPAGSLDPKLKETYNRVMSTQTPSPGSTPTLSGHAANQSAPAPINPPVTTTPPGMSTSPTPIQSGPTPTIPTTTPLPTPSLVTPSPSGALGQSPLGMPQKQEKIVITAQEGGSHTKQILYVVIAVLFFAAYTLFWMRYFNIISLPF